MQQGWKAREDAARAKMSARDEIDDYRARHFEAKRKAHEAKQEQEPEQGPNSEEDQPSGAGNNEVPLEAKKGPGGRWYLKRGKDIYSGPFESEQAAKDALPKPEAG